METKTLPASVSLRSSREVAGSGCEVCGFEVIKYKNPKTSNSNPYVEFDKLEFSFQLFFSETKNDAIIVADNKFAISKAR